MSRSTTSRVMVAIGGLMLALGVVVGYARDTFVDSDEFGDRAVEAFVSPEVREAITEQIVDQMIEAEPDLLSVRPLLGTVVDGVLGSDLAIDAFRAGVVDVHRTIFGGSGDTTTLKLADLILVAKTQLTTISPELGALVPDGLTDAIVSVRSEQFVVRALELADTLGLLAVLFPLLSLAAFVAAVWSSGDPARTVVGIGVAMLGAAVGIGVLEGVIAQVWTANAGDDAEVVTAVWEAFVGPLGAWLLTLAGVGVLIAAAAWFGLGDVDARPVVDRIAGWARPPATTGGRVGRAVILFLIGVVFVSDPVLVAQLAVTLVGAVFVGLGLRELAVTAIPRLSEGAAVDTDSVDADTTPGGTADTSETARAVRWTVTAMLVVVGGLIIGAVWWSGGSDAEVTDDAGCNGSEALCDRRLDEVVFAATHNSMAAARDGYTLGYQTDGIVPQLEDGIRGLLVDVYFGRQVEDDLVVTDRAPLTEDERDEVVEQYGESAVRSAESIAATTELSGVSREMFLCHAFCELGATGFVDELGRIREFLDDRPREVLMMIIQDEGPGPDDVAAAFEASGLIDLVATLEREAPLPTLEELVDAGTRVVVATENDAGGFAWYHAAFELMQDTPFTFESVDDFTCELNRGEPDNPLFLVNHWLSPVAPSAADVANRADVLDERIVDCLEVRDRIPNLIAVDFHDRGDLLDFVDRLNDE